MVWRFLLVAFALLLGARTSVSAAEQPEAVVQRSLQAYCDKNGVKKEQLKPAKLSLLPRMEAFRYPLKAVPADQKNGPLRERFAVIFVDSAYGGIIEFKVMANEDYKKTCRNLIAAMTLTGRKVTNGREATAVIADLFGLDSWLLGHPLGAYPTEQEFREGAGPYRGRPRTYSNGGRGHLELVGADDFGIEVDADGFIIAFLCGHIR